MKMPSTMAVLFAAVMMGSVANVRADAQAETPADRAGGKSYSQYAAPESTQTRNSGQYGRESGTVPSGKRHRTHKKSHPGPETTEDMKTIQSGDATHTK